MNVHFANFEESTVNISDASNFWYLHDVTAKCIMLPQPRTSVDDYTSAPLFAVDFY